MSNTVQNSRTVDSIGIPVVIGSLVVLPLVLLQFTVGQDSSSEFPLALFVFLWVLPTVFVAVLAPLVRRIAGGEGVFQRRVDLALRLLLLLAIGSLWLSVVNDQMPCFLGVPNCD